MKARNFVAKHAHLAGKAGVHANKGKHVKRALARRLVRKEVENGLGN
jgi:hypothetical protein